MVFYISISPKIELSNFPETPRLNCGYKIQVYLQILGKNVSMNVSSPVTSTTII